MIRLSSLLEFVEMLPDGNLRITDLTNISDDQWERINRIMVQKGYNMRGGDDCKRAIGNFLTNPNNIAPDVIRHDIYGPWVDTIQTVMHLKGGMKKNSDHNFDAKKVLRSAVREFGLTNNMREAGYILPNGGLLALSGNPNHRDKDHREVASVFMRLKIDLPKDKLESAAPYIEAFTKGCGAIRIGGSQNVLDMWHEPTRQQAVQLLKFFELYDGDILMVVKSDKWGMAERYYDDGTASHTILRDIVAFYRSGQFLSQKPSRGV